MDYNINIKHKSSGGSGSSPSPLGASGGMRQKAIQASQKQGSLSPDSASKKLIDSTVKLSTNILKLNQSVTMLTAVIKSRGLGGGGGGNTPIRDQGNGGIGAVGSALGYVGVPVALAGFAVSKINQVGNAYIEKVSQQKGTVGIAGMSYNRRGAYMGPEVSSGKKAHLMASGSFKGNIDDRAFKVGTIFGDSAETVGSQSGAISRYTGSDYGYGKIAEQGLGSGIQTDLPKFMAGVVAEMEDSVKNGVNASSLSTDIGQEVSSLTSHTQTKSVDMALNMINKFKGTKDSASMGKISGVNELFAWKSGQDKLMSGLNDTSIVDKKTGLTAKDKTINSWAEQGLIDPEMASQLKAQKGNMDMEGLRKIVGQSGVSMLTKDTISGMGTAEGLRANMGQWQKQFGTGSQAMAIAHNIYSQNGGDMDVKQFGASWQNSKDPKLADLTEKGKKILNEKFNKTEGSTAMMGLKKTQMMDDLLYEHGKSFADTTIAMEKALISLADTLAETVIPLIKKVSGGKVYTPAEKKRLEDSYDTRWTDVSIGL